MNFRAPDLYQLAERLHRQSRDLNNVGEAGLREAMLRGAISRAYYAAFWCGRDYFENATPPQPLSEFNAHYELRKRFEAYEGHSKTMKSIRRKLKDLLEMRRQADYDAVVPNLERLTADALFLQPTVCSMILALCQMIPQRRPETFTTNSPYPPAVACFVLALPAFNLSKSFYANCRSHRHHSACFTHLSCACATARRRRGQPARRRWPAQHHLAR